jgi:hypothetical protein
MRLSAGELSIGYRDHLVGSGVDLALTAGEVLGAERRGEDHAVSYVAWTEPGARRRSAP